MNEIGRSSGAHAIREGKIPPMQASCCKNATADEILACQT